jgi:predicted nucleotidyltransferase
MVQIFTLKERKIIEKKSSGKKLSQVESNRLSKAIRPKLREISSIDANQLIERLEYVQKAYSIENRIKKIILENMSAVDSIILYGSAIQNNYHDYNDIDIIVVTKKKIYKRQWEKWKIENKLKEILFNNGIKSDMQIISKKAILYNSTRNPNLIYQLKDHKVIYGKINLPNKIEIYNVDLHMKLDFSRLYSPRPKGEEIYHALRNAVLVRLLLNKIVDNGMLKESLYNELGKNLVERLKNNKESKLDRKIAIAFLKQLVQDTREKIKGGLWEKIEISK